MLFKNLRYCKKKEEEEKIKNSLLCNYDDSNRDKTKKIYTCIYVHCVHVPSHFNCNTDNN